MLIEICKERGLFELLRDGEFRDRDSLIAQLNANAGAFAVALDALADAGVLERRGELYRATGAAPAVDDDAAASALTAAELRALLVVGFCGGFTTFSTFTYETVGLIEGGDYARATIYVLASVAICILATFAGMAAMGAVRTNG